MGRIDELLAAERNQSSHDYRFEDEKINYLEHLVSELHITEMGEEPAVFFKKLIELYGEEYLSEFRYVYREELEYPRYYDVEDMKLWIRERFRQEEVFGGEPSIEEIYERFQGVTREELYEALDGFLTKEEIDEEIEKENLDVMDTGDITWTYTIFRFINGSEDEVIDLVSDKKLRENLLASKLMSIYRDNDSGIYYAVRECFYEYVDALTKNGQATRSKLDYDFDILSTGYVMDGMLHWDDYGHAEFEDTLAEFSMWGISKDRNFYLYLAKHLDEEQLPLETFIKYIDPDMIDEEFIQELVGARNSKQYEYQDRFAKPPQIRKAMEAGLNEKEETLKKLEDEAKEISEAETLIEKIDSKDQGIGEE